MMREVSGRDDGVGQVEDYTGAFLGMAYLVGMTGLMLVWGAWSYVAALATCGACHVAIQRLGQRRRARETNWEARVEAALARARQHGR